MQAEDAAHVIKLSARDFAKLQSGNYAVPALMGVIKSSKQGEDIAAFETVADIFTGRIFLGVVDNPRSTPPVVFGLFAVKSPREAREYYEQNAKAAD